MDASSDIWKSVMFSFQRKLSGCCWHTAQHFLDCDVLAGDKMSPGHMTCFCFAHSHSVLKIFKWSGEKGRLCHDQSSEQLQSLHFLRKKRCLGTRRARLTA